MIIVLEELLFLAAGDAARAAVGFRNPWMESCWVSLTIWCLAITKKADTVVVIKRKRIGDADDTLTPKEAKLVRRGEAQLRRGQSESWMAVKNALPR